MRHFILLLTLLTLGFSVKAQSWNFVGSSVGYNASEVDIEITPNGQLYMAYVDTDNSNKVTVRKWNGSSWQLVGSAGISTANVSDIQLVVTNEDYPAVALKGMYSTYEVLEIYKWSGAAWQFQGIGDPIWTYHSKDYSLRANTSGQLILTFFNRTQAFPIGLITVNLATQTQLGGDLDQGNAGNALTSYAGANNNVTVIHEENDMSDYLTLDQYVLSSWNNYSFSGSDAASKIKAEKGIATSNLGVVWKNEDNTPKLKFAAVNASGVPGAELTLQTSSNLGDFDFDTQGDNAYVFYRDASTCYFKQVSTLITPSATTITSGVALAPANATSMAAETYYGVHVIAYVSSGKCYVKEYNLSANIEDYDLLTMCEGQTFNNNGDYAVICLDPNYSQANITMTCTSQNTAVLPQSAITIYPSPNNLSWYINISNTNNVTTPTIVDLLWTLYENGVEVGNLYNPVTINPAPNIQFLLNNASVCENAGDISLINKATPLGGTWSGTGVQNNIFHPSYIPVSDPTNVTLTYTKTNIYGCTASDQADVTVVPTPLLNVTTTDADCNATNGSAAVAVSEGQTPYDVYWSSGSTQYIVTNLAAGQYYISVTDANGCLSTQSVMIGTSGLNQSASVNNVICAGQSNGAIDITLNGGSGPFTYAWSNGATTQDLSNVPAGPYEVSITDQTGCVSMGSYTITQPQAILVNSITVTQASCGGSDGTATVEFLGGVLPFSYQWFDANGNNLNIPGTLLTGASAGSYSIHASDNNGCTLNAEVMISNNNGPVIAIDTIVASSCNNDGEIQVTDVSNNVQSYNWNNGGTTAHITALAPGTYVLEATGTNGCTSVLSANVESAQPVPVDICLVTVDTSTNTNLIVWEKPVTNDIASFNIYRETSQAGLYQLIGNVPYNQESIYNDLVASPSVRSWRYKISSVDACGIESDISEHHKTIHLVINLGLGSDINLSWDSYEGFVFPDFVIKRYTNADGWQTVTTMPVNLFTYTDTPPTTDGLVYLVTVDPPATCTSTRSTAQDFNSARSNKDNRLRTQDASLDELLEANLNVYPNPTNGHVQLQNNTSSPVLVAIYDASGRMLTSLQMLPGITETNLSDLSEGVYQLVFTAGDARTTRKLTITR